LRRYAIGPKVASLSFDEVIGLLSHIHTMSLKQKRVSGMLVGLKYSRRV
jgi:hypothetical protein